MKHLISGEVNKYTIKTRDLYILEYLRDELNSTKSKIDRHYLEWESVKKIIHDHEYVYYSSYRKKNISSVAPVSRSYFKFREIFYDFNMKIENINTVCNLAEAPGGFIESLIHLSEGKNMNIYANSLLSQDKSIPMWNNKIKRYNEFYAKLDSTNFFDIDEPDNINGNNALSYVHKSDLTIDLNKYLNTFNFNFNTIEKNNRIELEEVILHIYNKYLEKVTINDTVNLYIRKPININEYYIKYPNKYILLIDNPKDNPKSSKHFDFEKIAKNNTSGILYKKNIYKSYYYGDKYIFYRIDKYDNIRYLHKDLIHYNKLSDNSKFNIKVIETTQLDYTILEQFYDQQDSKYKTNDIPIIKTNCIAQMFKHYNVVLQRQTFVIQVIGYFLKLNTLLTYLVENFG